MFATRRQMIGAAFTSGLAGLAKPSTEIMEAIWAYREAVADLDAVSERFEALTPEYAEHPECSHQVAALRRLEDALKASSDCYAVASRRLWEVLHDDSGSSAEHASLFAYAVCRCRLWEVLHGDSGLSA